MRHRLLAVAVGLAALSAVSSNVGAEFKAPTVTLYIPSGVGGGYDVYGRLAARHLGRFLPGNPAIVPKNMPGAGGVVMANYLYNIAPKDGSAIALFQAGSLFEPLFGNPQTKFEPTKLNWLLSLNRLVDIGIFWHATPIRTTDDFFKDQVVVGSSGGSNASTEVFPKLLNNLAGTKFKVITGYTGVGETMLAMERGEVQGIVGAELSGFRAGRPDWIRDGKARIVLQIVLTKSPDLPGVASAIDLVKNEADREVFELLLTRVEHGRPFTLPPDTAPDIVVTFQRAFAAMVKDPAFLQDAGNIKADVNVTTGEDIRALLAKTYASPKPLLERAIAEFKKAGGSY
jgi:tripartite-type tricarboxylate transporter receptor subunit TctC